MSICPRCNKKWDVQEGIAIRSFCGMKKRGPDEYELSFNDDGSRPTIILWGSWRPKDKCQVFCKGRATSIDLPLLPYTITLEELNRYVVLV